MNAEIYDALVIGAGFAGLTAARDLANDGKRVLIIEARDRIGGRTWYRPFADTSHHIEMGGGWVDTHNTAIMQEIKRYDIKLAETPVAENFVSVLGGQRHPSPFPLSSDDVLGLERGIFRILTDARRFDPNTALDLQDAADLDIPLEAYLDALELPYNVRQLMGAWNRANTGCEESDVSALHPLSWFESLGGSVLAHWQFPSHTFADGTASLARVLLEDAACDISLNSPVEVVTHTAAHVEVTTNGGDRFRGTRSRHRRPLELLERHRVCAHSCHPPSNPARGSDTREPPRSSGPSPLGFRTSCRESASAPRRSTSSPPSIRLTTVISLWASPRVSADLTSPTRRQSKPLCACLRPRPA